MKEWRTAMTQQVTERMESPRYLRMSLAAAMTLGFQPGLFYRDARLYCVNLLLTYGSGCAGRCSYCGLSGGRPKDSTGKSFIRVAWPTHELDDIVASISARRDRVKRICISMVTSKRAVEDTKSVCARLRSSFDIPVSLLISPTVLDHGDLVDFRDAGADRIGVAIDLATRELFEKYRGVGVGGPHKWETYWECLTDALGLFGEGNAGSHFIVGMGETEEEMSSAIQKVRDLGGRTHLFSFFPEPGSAMENGSQPPMDQYRRVQLARFLIDEQLSRADRFRYDMQGRITDFGVRPEAVQAAVDSGEPFRTTGCRGYDGEVACNRPYANSRPGPLIRNYPFPPEPGDLARIRSQLDPEANPPDPGDEVDD